MHTKLIVMQDNLGLGHKGEIILTTQKRVDGNQPMLAKDIIDEKTAFEFLRRWNAFEEGGSHAKLLDACKLCVRCMELAGMTEGAAKDSVVEKLKAAIAAAEETKA